MVYPALNALALEQSGRSSRGLVATAFGGAFSLGQALSVIGLGTVADRVGYPAVFTSAALLTLTAVAALARGGQRQSEAVP
jgi:MFS family permease